MASDTSVALGLTEFVAKLIEETFNAITLSAQEQADRDAKFRAAAELSLSDFIEQHISDVEIDLKLEELFPAASGAGHAIVVGAPYSRGNAADEDPPVLARLGLALESGDYASGKLTDQGVDKIRAAARIAAGTALYESMKKMIGRGIPRVVVDKGRILTRLTFETHDLEDQSTTAAAPTVPAAVSPVRTAAASGATRFMFSKSASNILAVNPANLTKLSAIRFAVAPVKQETPDGEVRGSVYGEVEINFRTTGN